MSDSNEILIPSKSDINNNKENMDQQLDTLTKEQLITQLRESNAKLNQLSNTKTKNKTKNKASCANANTTTKSKDHEMNDDDGDDDDTDIMRCDEKTTEDDIDTSTTPATNTTTMADNNNSTDVDMDIHITTPSKNKSATTTANQHNINNNNTNTTKPNTITRMSNTIAKLSVNNNNNNNSNSHLKSNRNEDEEKQTIAEEEEEEEEEEDSAQTVMKSPSKDVEELYANEDESMQQAFRDKWAFISGRHRTEFMTDAQVREFTANDEQYAYLAPWSTQHFNLMASAMKSPASTTNFAVRAERCADMIGIHPTNMYRLSDFDADVTIPKMNAQTLKQTVVSLEQRIKTLETEILHSVTDYELQQMQNMQQSQQNMHTQMHRESENSNSNSNSTANANANAKTGADMDMDADADADTDMDMGVATNAKTKTKTQAHTIANGKKATAIIMDVENANESGNQITETHAEVDGVTAMQNKSVRFAESVRNSDSGLAVNAAATATVAKASQKKKKSPATGDIWHCPRWSVPIRADIRAFDFDALIEVQLRHSGRLFDVIMTDPPWVLASSNPTRGVALGYSQLDDNIIEGLPIQKLQTDGLLFLWVINAKYRLALKLLEHWGYKMIQDIAWVKATVNRRVANGHGFYLQHAKETCLVALKGKLENIPSLQSGIAADVIFSERRGQSQKPEEIYEYIERLVPRGFYLEIFARRNNLRDGWISIGNEL